MSKEQLKGFKQYQDRVLRYLPKGHRVNVRTTHRIITPNGGSGYREVYSICGVAFLEIEGNYCRDRSWVYMFKGFHERLAAACTQEPTTSAG